MDPEPQNHRFTLPTQEEENIKSAVRDSMPPPSLYVRRRRSVKYRKAIRWISLSLSIILVVGEIVVSLIVDRGINLDALFAFVWGPLLGIWNIWRLFRLRQKFDKEVISGWHIGIDALALSVTTALTVVLIIRTVSRARGYWYDYEFPYEDVWRAAGAAIFFLIWFLLHSIVLIMTMVEKWTKPKYSKMDAQPQQSPPIIVQYTPICANCRGHVEPQQDDEHLSNAGDSQPQGIAPALSIR